MSDKKLLTPLELKVMNLLWTKKKAFVKELLEHWPSDEKKPAYNTISTIIRLLEDKGFVAHESFGRTHRYFPKITKFVYQKTHLSNVLANVFSGSTSSLVSALLENEQIDEGDLNDIQSLIDKTKE